MPQSSPTRRRPACPQCGQALQRVPLAEAGGGQSPVEGGTRFQCGAAGCGWQGLLQRRRRRARARAVPRAVAAGSALAWPLAVRAGIGLALAVGVPAAMIVLAGLGLRLDRQAAASVPAGESHDGRPVAGDALRQASFSTPVAPGDTPADPLAAGAADEPALALRQGCAWGKPGRAPYLGTTEQALRRARLPEEVVQRIAHLRRTGAVSDRVEIRREAIRTVRDGREFNPRSFAMTFGRTLCVDSRVNFAPGHVERANLYEAQDRRGRHYAVMVPDVCGNVSVLGARGQRTGLAGAAAGVNQQRHWLRAAVEGGDDGPGLRTLGVWEAARTVPEPDALACVLAALAALAWVRRR